MNRPPTPANTATAARARKEVHFHFGPHDGPLAGSYRAAEGPVRDCVVVMCSPFGHEALTVHRTFRHLADALAHAGIASLRFDYAGTGDSSGDDEAPGQVRSWVDSVDGAVDEARRRSGARDVVLLGVRLGATIAWEAANRRSDLDGFVFIAPCADGHGYLRELRAYATMHGRSQRLPEGAEEAFGYYLSPETVAELSALSPGKRGGLRGRRALIVARDDLPGREARVASTLSALGVDVEMSNSPGYGAMAHEDPYQSLVPEAILSKVVDWVAQGHASTRRDSIGEAPARAAWTTPVRMKAGEAFVRERFARFGDDASMVGVFTAPDHPGEPRPPIVFLNVGANRRVGIGRISTIMARALAREGWSSFRFDLTGLGDSEAKADREENELYSDHSLEDVRRALAELERETGSHDFVLAGLCSGAYMAFQVALRDDEARVAAIALINPKAFHWREGDEISFREPEHWSQFRSSDYYRARLFRPGTWRKLLRGDVRVAGILKTLATRQLAKVRAELRYRFARPSAATPDGTDLATAFAHLARKGVFTTLVFNADASMLDTVRNEAGPALRGGSARRLALHAIQGADHTFTRRASKAELIEVVSTELSGWWTRRVRARR